MALAMEAPTTTPMIPHGTSPSEAVKEDSVVRIGLCEPEIEDAIVCLGSSEAVIADTVV